MTLTAGPARASVHSVGASLASLKVGERDLVVPFDPADVRPVFRGALLAPWANRIVDGRYRFAGEEHQLALTESARGHALHGLVAWQEFSVVAQSASAVTLSAEVVPQTGYPWRIRLHSRFELSESGLQQTVTATNLGTTSAPYGVAAHHYLVAGSGPLDSWQLTLDAARVMLTEGERLLPGDVVGVEADPDRFDFRAGRILGDVEIDHAFEGASSATLVDAHGVGVRMEWGAECGWIQVHTADRPEPGLHRAGLAVEPMTCAPDAFNSGVGLIELEPGQRHSASWTISAVS